MGTSRSTGEWTQSLLHDLSVGLGLTMFGRIEGVADWLVNTPGLTPDLIARRVLDAEGLDPVIHERAFDQARASAAKWFPSGR
jgi:hypothetical protein